jgi:DNA-binding HxlR family transcriptional regulator
MSTPRVDPSTLPGRPCAAAAALELVGDRWALLAVREVMFGNHQFSQIARNTGAPRDRLAARLKSLVEAGVLERRPHDQATRSRFGDGYYLTEAGGELGPVITALRVWGDRWAVTTPLVRTRHHDHDLVATTICATCGEEVHPDDVTRATVDP